MAREILVSSIASEMDAWERYCLCMYCGLASGVGTWGGIGPPGRRYDCQSVFGTADPFPNGKVKYNDPSRHRMDRIVRLGAFTSFLNCIVKTFVLCHRRSQSSYLEWKTSNNHGLSYKLVRQL